MTLMQTLRTGLLALDIGLITMIGLIGPLTISTPSITISLPLRHIYIYIHDKVRYINKNSVGVDTETRPVARVLLSLPSHQPDLELKTGRFDDATGDRSLSSRHHGTSDQLDFGGCLCLGCALTTDQISCSPIWP